MNRCWCGNESLNRFNQDYSECEHCHTLVSNFDFNSIQSNIENDDEDYYGKTYWLAHQANNIQYPDIYQRSRLDLSERNLHWLKTFLKYAKTPKRVLEVGSGHGGFLALLKHIGFDVCGMELSPWVVEYAKNTFQVPMHLGPVEKVNFADKKFDVIVLMDVLKHLPNPMDTLKQFIDLLSEDGFLLIQTPNFPFQDQTLRQSLSGHAFTPMMINQEHLYLFSETSVETFFQNLGMPHIKFEPAIFSHYDMFFVVSRHPIDTLAQKEIDEHLSASVNARIIQALLDLRESEQRYIKLYQAAEQRAILAENNVSSNFQKLINKIKKVVVD